MIRFLKSSAFKIFAVIAAALLAGSVFAVASRSGSSPLTSVISVVFGPLSRLSSYVAAEFADIPVSFKSSSELLKENENLQKKIDNLYLIEQDGVVFFKVSFLVQNNKKLINFAFAYYAPGKVEKTSIDTELANELLKIKLEDVYLKEFPGKKITSVTCSEVYAVVYEEIEYIRFMGFRTTFEGEEVPYDGGNLGILIPLSMIKSK